QRLIISSLGARAGPSGRCATGAARSRRWLRHTAAMANVTARDEDAEIHAPHGGWAQFRFSDSTGRTTATQLVCRPDRPSRLLSAMPAPEGRSLIARGGGQGLGDAALNDGGAVALTVRLDRML